MIVILVEALLVLNFIDWSGGVGMLVGAQIAQWSFNPRPGRCIVRLGGFWTLGQRLRGQKFGGVAVRGGRSGVYLVRNCR